MNIREYWHKFRQYLPTGILESPEDRSVLVACMLISIIFWFGISLTEKYDTVIPIPIEYTNFPKGKVVTNEQPDTLLVYVKQVPGKDLLRQMRFNPQALKLDVGKALRTSITDSIITFETRTLTKEIQQQLSYTNVPPEGIEPNSILLTINERGRKKIAIAPHFRLKAANHFEIDQSQIKIQPDSVWISGPKYIVETYTQWETDSIIHLELNATVDSSIQLVNPKQEYIKLDQDKIRYTIGVEEFTESTLSLPVKTINKPDSISLFIYPNTVNIKFQIGLSNYAEAKVENFQAVADFSEVNFQKDQKVPVSISTTKNILKMKNVLLQPDKVDFIIMAD